MAAISKITAGMAQTWIIIELTLRIRIMQNSVVDPKFARKLEKVASIGRICAITIIVLYWLILFCLAMVSAERSP